MNLDSTARKYAEALFGIGMSTGKLAVFQSNADDFLRIVKSSGDLMTSLSHPNIRKKQRMAIIEGVLSRCSYDAVFSNFIRLVVERGRIACYPRIVSSFVGLRDEADGRVRGVVYVAVPMSRDQHERLRRKAADALGHEVLIEERIDPGVIGGLRLEIGGRVYDSSVRRHLERLRESMGGRL